MSVELNFLKTVKIILIMVSKLYLKKNCNLHVKCDLLFIDCNVIPLPPKDPRAVQQLTASKPRHQRKYPLVMPNSVGTDGLLSQGSPTVNNEQQMFSDQIICSTCIIELLKITYVFLIIINQVLHFIA